MEKFLRVTMPDGSKWDVPVSVIARNRAEFYKDEYDGDVEKSLKADTLPLFNENGYEIADWAANNMDWKDVKSVAKKVDAMPDCDFQDGWINGDKEIIEREAE
jgi:hypothetical protein